MEEIKMTNCPVFLEDGNLGVNTPFGANIPDYPTKGKTGSHYGVDIVRRIGWSTLATIVAFADGIVTEIKTDVTGVDHNTNKAGNYIRIDHGNGYETRYLHLKHKSIPDTVFLGGTVKRGEVIGYMGNTGDSYGAHLHFEVWEDGVRIDPLPYLLGQKQLEKKSSVLPTYIVQVDAVYDDQETAEAMRSLLEAAGVKATVHVSECITSPSDDKSAVTLIHTVVKGDRMSSIAKKYDVSVDAIVNANKDKYPSISASYIVIGWKLTIPKEDT